MVIKWDGDFLISMVFKVFWLRMFLIGYDLFLEFE